MALSIASNYALDKTMYKDTYTVITDYDNPKLIADSCSFNVKLLFKDEKTEKEWKGPVMTNTNLSKPLAFKFKTAGFSGNSTSENKITFYILDVENPNPLLSLPFMQRFPFVESVVEVEINNKLASRYVLFGVLKNEITGLTFDMFSVLFSKIKKHCRVESVAKEGE